MGFLAVVGLLLSADDFARVYSDLIAVIDLKYKASFPISLVLWAH
jgi:hypothetical protein